MTATRPCVHVEPGMRFGRPHVKGVSVEILTELYAAGDDPLEIYDECGITRADFLVACWYAGMYGARGERAWLGSWAAEQHPAMWHGEWEAVTDPPEKPKRAKR